MLKYPTKLQLKHSAKDISFHTLMQSITQARDKSAWAIAWALKSVHGNLSRLLVNGVEPTTTGLREAPENFLHMLLDIAEEFGDEELKAAVCTLDHLHSFISRLLDHGADPTVQETTSRNSPLDLALQSSNQKIMFMLLNSFKERTEFKLSIAKTKSEKSEILRAAGSVLARLMYHECAQLSSDNTISWILLNSTRDRGFIFGTRSIKLWEMYVDQEGCSAMHIAAKKGQSRAFGKMLAMKFPVDMVDAYGRTPKDLAKSNNRLKVLFLLMDKKDKLGPRVIWCWDDMRWVLQTG
jgi:ankyrin repeat protein